jgi:hypothetical protein
MQPPKYTADLKDAKALLDEICLHEEHRCAGTWHDRQLTKLTEWQDDRGH